jgi:ribosome-associated toxin RatA of RatAB toxin-antitoxin module
MKGLCRPAAPADTMTVWRVAALGVAALVLSVHESGAATIAIDVQRRGNRIDIQASAALKADGAAAWRILTDYERYIEFIPDLRTSRVLGRAGRTVIVEQSGAAKLWMLRIPLEVTYEITEIPQSRLRSRVVAGSLQTLDSDYQLTVVASGVRLDYTGHVARGPGVFGALEQWAVEGSIARQFQALADAIELRAPAAAIHIAP